MIKFAGTTDFINLARQERLTNPYHVVMAASQLMAWGNDQLIDYSSAYGSVR